MSDRVTRVNTLILGAGAAGLMAAAQAGPGVLLVDHARAPGEKIRISGGGRCNFTNLDVGPENYLSENPHFCKSALARYTQWDFIELVSRHGIAWHEKTLGQLFCDGKATQIIDMLLSELRAAGADLWLQTSIAEVRHAEGRFHVTLDQQGTRRKVVADSLVLATGGKSIPKMGATGLAYDLARQFGHEIIETRPALVPFTFDKGRFTDLAGVSVPAVLSNNRARFAEALLFTHRGLSGPAVLQLSSYWREGEDVIADLAPGVDIDGHLKAARQTNGRRALTTELGALLPAKLVAHLAQAHELTGTLADLTNERVTALAEVLHGWRVKPTGTEGYRTAEVTLGGISTDGLDSKTLMSKHLPGLYALGEAVDVTGWLGGYNFQWAWASAVAVGRAIRAARETA
ncbi:NAD(P)/FAD-dependent oxidoreductase [Sagittula salina]|uniref:NAD(P)/FAD-dependent oxidoreductase n=1 Tax=Sagittula salina TaxID=2820268 RepID=A0A940MMJ8_9RHOB|nr:NAD(P)/FAD-dependent oxidoreductase [Sagittula salina]MBP0484256.1 NAD(P)/FAD-dependent oxidoreductase [Sagittula salina]